MDHQDVSHALRVIAEMGAPDRAWVLKGTYGPREMLGLIGELDLAVGMRPHFLIFAARTSCARRRSTMRSRAARTRSTSTLPRAGAVARDVDGREVQRELLRQGASLRPQIAASLGVGGAGRRDLPNWV
ncbi:MAG: hypothetical protein QOI48_4690 [Solirubrobacteraceae bacterium]|jgi:hypothetical protein|nr:hypothetical protein [Solirubrobacteraceae bacterium]